MIYKGLPFLTFSNMVSPDVAGFKVLEFKNHEGSCAVLQVSCLASLQGSPKISQPVGRVSPGGRTSLRQTAQVG